MRPTPDKMRAFMAQLRKKMNFKSLVVTLAAIVVFTTTYLLVLPAFTLDKEEAAEQGGIDVVAVETAADADQAEKDAVPEEAAADADQAEKDAVSTETAADADQTEKDAVPEEKAEPKEETGKAKPADKDDSADKKDAEEKSSVKLLKGKKTITAEKADGDDFEVSAVVDGNAKLPEDVFITATELNKDTEGFDYEQYKKDVLEALKKDSSFVEEIKSIRFYDISLESESQDDTVEPEAPVNVKIEYEDGMKVDSDDVVHIIHFAEQKNGEVKAEVLDAEENNVEAVVDEKESKLSEASFDADGFSVYAIASSGATGNLDGKSFAIINTYNLTAVQDTNQNNNTRLREIRVALSNDNKVRTASNVPISLWTFTHVPNQANNVYYIRNANGQYLNIQNRQEGYVRVSDTAQPIQVATSNNRQGLVRLRAIVNGNVTDFAVNDFNNGNINDGFGAYNDSGNNEWFRLYDLNQIDDDKITVYYVDESGREIAPSKDISQTTKVSGASDYTDTYKYGDVYSLYQPIEGYAYQSTHLNTYNGTQINAEVVLNTADSYNYHNDTPDTEDQLIQKASYRWEYQEPKAGVTYNHPTEYDTQPFADGSKVYVVYKEGSEEIPGHDSGGGGGSGEDLDEPKPVKELKPNGDGTYELSLSVNASSKPIDKSRGANIIMVFDMSASMDSNISGTNRTRLTAAREAARNVGTGLLALNAGHEDNPLVEIMVIPFNATTLNDNESQWFTTAGTNSTTNTDLDVFNGYINRGMGRTAAGTNWERAIKRAKVVADAKKASGDKDDTYIIFLTDGNPWVGDSYGDMPHTHDATKHNFMQMGAYFYAAEPARQIVKAGYELYGIGMYGNVDVLHFFTNFAYTGRSTYDPTGNSYGHYFPAQQQEQLVQALSDIAGTITGNLAMAGVDFKDGVALDTTHTSLTTGGKVNGVSYSRSAGTAPGSVPFTVRVGTDGTPMFSINGGAEQAGRTVSKQYTKINDDGTTTTASKDIYRLGNTDYEMPIASLDEAGNLDWDLSPLGQLEDGVTFTITTTVWPDQEAYDLVTDLNNGLATWDESAADPVLENGVIIFYQGGASKDGKTYDHIVKYPDGHYAALSNTYQKLDYFVVDTEGDETTYEKKPTINLRYPDPMGLRDDTVLIKKVWEKDMMPTADLPPEVELTLLRDDEPFIPGIKLNDGNDWETSKYIAPGMMILKTEADRKGISGTVVNFNDGTSTKQYVILNTGYDYKFSEKKTPDTANFQLEETIYHPMLVGNEDGSTLMDVKINGTNVTLSGNDISQGLIARNHLKGGINIDKVVKDSSGTVDPTSTDVFEADVTLTAPMKDGEPDFTDVEDAYEEDPETGDYIIDDDGNYVIYKPSVAWYRYINKATGRNVYDEELINAGILEPSGQENQYGRIGQGENYWGGGFFLLDFDDDTGIAEGTVKIHPQYTLRFTKIAAGTTYSVTETESSSAGYDVTYSYTHQKYEDGQPLGPPSTDPEGEDHVVAVNQANNVTVTNKPVKSDLIIIKSDDKGKAITSADDTAEFKLEKNTKNDGSGLWENAVDADDNPQLIVNGKVTINSTDGIVLKGLANGLYRLTETKAPDGYVIVEGSVTFMLENGVVTFVKIIGTTVEEIKPPEGYTITEKTATIPVKITVANPPGTPLPHTGGIGTTIFYILGSLLAVGCGIVLIARRRAGISR